MSLWWRAYDDALNDPKVQELPPALFKRWFNILCVASKYGGNLPNNTELSYCLRGRCDHVQRDVNELLKRGLLDEENGVLTPHNWRKRQYKSDNSTDRSRASRQRKCNDAATPPEYRVQNTETDSKKDSTPKASEGQLDFIPPTPPSRPTTQNPNFVEFWKVYPRKVGRKAALKSYERASMEVPPDKILSALKSQIPHWRGKEPQYIPHPTTWLGEGRWDDVLVPQKGSINDPWRGIL